MNAELNRGMGERATIRQGEWVTMRQGEWASAEYLATWRLCVKW